MKTGLCNFSGYKIYPGKGVRFIRQDAKTFTFVDSKSKHLFLNRKNPRKVAWTQAYRRLHPKKGITEGVIKKKTRRVQKVERAIAGASLELIRQKKNQKPELRAAAREAALREAKEKQKAKAEAKAAASPKPAASSAKPAAKSAAKPAAKAGAKSNTPKVQKSAGKGAAGGKGR